MRKVLTVLVSALALIGLGIQPAQAAGHQFRGHISTTATVGQEIVIQGHGIISGLGVTTVTGAETADQQTGAITGSAVFTAASGDQLVLSWTDVPVTFVSPTQLTFAGSMQVAGGTGRLANRSGEIGFSGGFDFVTSEGWFDVSGHLS